MSAALNVVDPASMPRYAVVGCQIASAHDLGVVAALELGVLVLVGEQRSQAHDLGALDVAEALQALDHVVELLGTGAVALRAGDGAAARHEQMRVLRHDDVLVVKLQRLVEALAQLGQILQRAAQEGDVSPDGTAACEAGDGLGHHGLEDRRRDVLLACALVEQRLHIGFGEHAAAAGDGVDRGVAFGELVQAARVGVQKRGHLVDERAGAARAGTVHALLDALVEVDDLGVLAAQLDGDVGFGDERLHRRLGRDDLLHELDAEPLRQKQAARAGDGDGHHLVAELLRRLLQHLDDGGAHVRMMTLVDGVAHVLRVVENRQLHRGGAHVDADMQAIFPRTRRRSRIRSALGFAVALVAGVHGLVRHDRSFPR